MAGGELDKKSEAGSPRKLMTGNRRVRLKKRHLEIEGLSARGNNGFSAFCPKPSCKYQGLLRIHDYLRRELASYRGNDNKMKPDLRHRHKGK